MRNWLTQGFRRVLIKRSRELTAETLQRPAIIFSPHQDDETLGCGGTIIRKIEAGAEVQVVFMTDGHQSHKHLLSPERLSSLREQEAAAACAILGVPASHVSFLRFPDGNLFGHVDEASKAVGEILEQSAAADLYIPYDGEPTDDHKATHAILRKALAAQSRTYTIFEYVVWYWHHWPWVTLFQSDRPNRLFVLKNTVRAFFGLGLLRFRCRVSVKAVLEQKMRALNEHQTQMTQLLNNPAWLTLYDVSNGEFINNLFQDYEMFHQCVYTPLKGTD